MEKSRFTEEQMVAMLREADRTSVAEVSRKYEVSDRTLDAWRRRFGRLAPADVKRVRDSLEHDVADASRRKGLAVRYVPNALTLLRLLLIPVQIVLLVQREYGAAFVIFIFSALSDFADGVIARRWNAHTRFGAIADPVVDKLTMLAVTLTLAVQGLLPRWVVAAIIVRDVVIVSGALAYHYLVGRYDMAPTVTSKLNTGFEFLVLALVLGTAAGILDAGAALPVLYAVLITTIAISGVQYVWVWGGRAISHCAARSRSTGT